MTPINCGSKSPEEWSSSLVMKTMVIPKQGRRPHRAYTLPIVLLTLLISIYVMYTVMDWTTSNVRLNERNNQYHETLLAAEAATEKVLASVIRDFKDRDEAYVHSNLDNYRTAIPLASEESLWGNYEFNNASGAIGETFVDRIGSETFGPLDSEYRGLLAFSYRYRMVSNARRQNALFDITAANQQEVQLSLIPIFQFAIFYDGYLDLNPGASMQIQGRVHTNTEIWTGPNGSLQFEGDVTSVGTNTRTRHPNDPGYNPNLTPDVSYNGITETNVSAMVLPIGTNTTSAAIHAIVELAPAGEDVNSPIGRQRFYNKAELVVIVGDSGINAKIKQPFGATATDIPESAAESFVDISKTFTDQREGKVVKVTEIDVAAMSSWAATSPEVQSELGPGTAPNLIYVADVRTTSGSQITGVRLVNGQILPNRGLTVATPDPLYVKGHYNQPNPAHLGTANTSETAPASLVSDGMTVLSQNWQDNKSNWSYYYRTAADTTINAAILTGNVPWSPPTTPTSYYSGGAHNLTRYLEKWSGKTVTYNTSLVSLFPSQKATGLFQQSGGYYNIPNRKLYFDENFLDPSKLPPGTPAVHAVIRSKWLVPPNGTVNYAGN